MLSSLHINYKYFIYEKKKFYIYERLLQNTSHLSLCICEAVDTKANSHLHHY